jgi:hypothetical protein
MPQLHARCGFWRSCETCCTIFGHLPVGGAHSIERQADKVARFLLTLKIEGVKQTRSLTRSKV